MGAAGDRQCTETLSSQYGTDVAGRCFVRECVEHHQMRVSLGWFTPGADLNLFVRDPQGRVYNASANYPNPFTGRVQGGTFTRYATGSETGRGRFLENVVFDVPEPGEYEIWVGLNNAAQSPLQEIAYTIEVERSGSMPTRQQFSGNVYAQRGSATPTVFSMCAAEGDADFCNRGGLCGLAQGVDNCGNQRTIDCGYCSLGAWQQAGPTGAGNWQVSPDNLSVLQTTNGAPTVYVSQQDFQDVRVRGTFRVEPDQFMDDDWIGFVFGYQNPLPQSPQASNYWDTFVLAWKQKPQSGAAEGFTLAYAKGVDPVSWSMAPSDKLRVLGTVTGTGEGWKYQRDYNLELIYERQRIRVLLDGRQLFDMTAAQAGIAEFPPGRFGFYNHSQAMVRYSNFITYPLNAQP